MLPHPLHQRQPSNSVSTADAAISDRKGSSEGEHQGKSLEEDKQPVHDPGNKLAAPSRHVNDGLAAFVSAGTLQSSVVDGTGKEEARNGSLSSLPEEAADGHQEEANRKRKEESDAKEQKKAKKIKLKREAGDKEGQEDGHGKAMRSQAYCDGDHESRRRGG